MMGCGQILGQTVCILSGTWGERPQLAFPVDSVDGAIRLSPELPTSPGVPAQGRRGLSP